MILVIDDDSAVRSSLSFMFKRAVSRCMLFRLLPRPSVCSGYGTPAGTNGHELFAHHHRAGGACAIETGQGLLSAGAGHTDDGLGKHSTGGGRNEGGCF